MFADPPTELGLFVGWCDGPGLEVPFSQTMMICLAHHRGRRGTRPKGPHRLLRASSNPHAAGPAAARHLDGRSRACAEPGHRLRSRRSVVRGVRTHGGRLAGERWRSKHLPWPDDHLRRHRRQQRHRPRHRHPPRAAGPRRLRHGAQRRQGGQAAGDGRPTPASRSSWSSSTSPTTSRCAPASRGSSTRPTASSMSWSTTPASAATPSPRSARRRLYLDVMNVNLCGAVRCLQQVLPGMRERRAAARSSTSPRSPDASPRSPSRRTSRRSGRSRG